MRILFIFHFLLIVNAAFAANEKALGILVQVKNDELLISKPFKDLIRQKQLIAGNYYSSLKVKSYKLDPKSKNDLKALCDIIQHRFSDVVSCEINFILTPNSASFENTIENESHQCNPKNTLFSYIYELGNFVKDIDTKDCDLFGKSRLSSKFKLTPGLTPFWAQEYIGSDILKEEMSQRKIDTSRTADLLQIWDSSNGNHGEQVANLIAGP